MVILSYDNLTYGNLSTAIKYKTKIIQTEIKTKIKIKKKVKNQITPYIIFCGNSSMATNKYNINTIHYIIPTIIIKKKK